MVESMICLVEMQCGSGTVDYDVHPSWMGQVYYISMLDIGYCIGIQQLVACSRHECLQTVVAVYIRDEMLKKLSIETENANVWCTEPFHVGNDAL